MSIIAFIALVFISYVTFVGATYENNGNFVDAGIYMVGVFVSLAVVFIGSQFAKATIRKFSRMIWLERFGIIASPVVFYCCIQPYISFSAVHSHNDEIVEKFTAAIDSSKQMFEDYEEYSSGRQKNYARLLERVISNRSVLPEQFAECGFVAGKEQIQMKNMQKTLQLQLQSANYDSLKIAATEWIETSGSGASTWNVFLLGNTREIMSAIKNWHGQLCEFSQKKLSNEEFKGYNKVNAFDQSGESFKDVETKINELTDLFSKAEFSSGFSMVSAYLIAVLLYFSLLFPYILQDRNTKSVYTLLGMKKGYVGNECVDIRMPQDKKTEENVDMGDSSADDYESFTL